MDLPPSRHGEGMAGAAKASGLQSLGMARDKNRLVARARATQVSRARQMCWSSGTGGRADREREGGE